MILDSIPMELCRLHMESLIETLQLEGEFRDGRIFTPKGRSQTLRPPGTGQSPAIFSTLVSFDEPDVDNFILVLVNPLFNHLASRHKAGQPLLRAKKRVRGERKHRDLIRIP
jgi:hypothetical protein